MTLSHYIQRNIIIFTLSFCFLNACNVQQQQTPPPNTPTPTPTPSSSTEEENKFTWTGWLTFSNTGLYRKLLFDYQICDRGVLTSILNADCNNWDRTAHMKLSFNQLELPNKVKLELTPYLTDGLLKNNKPHSTNIIGTGQARTINNFQGFQAQLNNDPSIGGAIVYLFIDNPNNIPAEQNNTLFVNVYYQHKNDASKIGTAELHNPNFDDNSNLSALSR